MAVNLAPFPPRKKEELARQNLNPNGKKREAAAAAAGGGEKRERKDGERVGEPVRSFVAAAASEGEISSTRFPFLDTVLLLLLQLGSLSPGRPTPCCRFFPLRFRRCTRGFDRLADARIELGVREKI